MLISQSSNLLLDLGRGPTQLTPPCLGHDRGALSAHRLVGDLSATLRDLPYTLFGGLASNAAHTTWEVIVQGSEWLFEKQM